jgi:hypothetical protein
LSVRRSVSLVLFLNPDGVGTVVLKSFSSYPLKSRPGTVLNSLLSLEVGLPPSPSQSGSSRALTYSAHSIFLELALPTVYLLAILQKPTFRYLDPCSVILSKSVIAKRFAFLSSATVFILVSISSVKSN